MEFYYRCWLCRETNTIWGKKVASWWSDKYQLPSEFTCWRCDAVNDLTAG